MNGKLFIFFAHWFNLFPYLCIRFRYMIKRYKMAAVPKFHSESISET